MIRIDKAADLADMWGGQTHFAVAVYWVDEDGVWDLIAAGPTVADAVREAREAFRDWSFSDIPEYMRTRAEQSTEETR